MMRREQGRVVACRHRVAVYDVEVVRLVHGQKTFPQNRYFRVRVKARAPDEGAAFLRGRAGRLGGSSLRTIQPMQRSP